MKIHSLSRAVLQDFVGIAFEKGGRDGFVCPCKIIVNFLGEFPLAISFRSFVFGFCVKHVRELE